MLIFAAHRRREAVKRFREWQARWQVEEEPAVGCLEKDLVNCLHYFAFDPTLWKSIRTTDILERAFQEERRRPWPLNNFFTKEASSNRMM